MRIFKNLVEGLRFDNYESTFEYILRIFPVIVVSVIIGTIFAFFL